MTTVTISHVASTQHRRKDVRKLPLSSSPSILCGSSTLTYPSRDTAHWRSTTTSCTTSAFLPEENTWSRATISVTWLFSSMFCYSYSLQLPRALSTHTRTRTHTLHAASRLPWEQGTRRRHQLTPLKVKAGRVNQTTPTGLDL